MFSSIVPLSVFSDVLFLWALGAAVASPRMSTLARPVIATFVFLCAWLVTAVIDALRAPAWTVFLGVAVIVLGMGVVATTLHAWTQDDGGSEGEAGDDGPGGAAWGPPAAPQGGGTDPNWWPEFERELALYAATAQLHGNGAPR